MSEKRNLDRMKSYESSNSEGLAAMKKRNIQQYGREEGPTPEQLFEKYVSWEEVIYGSVRTSPTMKSAYRFKQRIGGYELMLEEKQQQHTKWFLE